MAKVLEVLIAPDGTIRAIHSDALEPILAAVGDLDGDRASHVEPVTAGGRIRWQADMSPVGGPALPLCNTRSEALKAETDWLVAHNLPIPLALRERLQGAATEESV